jgi:hypothetical protein
MMYSATPTGMRVWAGDYRDADVRWAQARRAAKAANAAKAAKSCAPTGDAVLPASTTRFARLRTLIPHAR